MPASFRSRVRAGVEPIARLFGRVGLTPNMLTLIGFAIAVVGAWLAATEAWLLSGLIVAFGAIFDLFDGALARATNRTSNFGAFLDSTTDRAGEAVVYLGIAVGLLSPTIMAQARLGIPDPPSATDVGAIVAIGAMAASFMVSYTRAKSESLGFSPGKGMANVGLAPREVRTVILVLGLVTAGILVGSQVGDYPAGFTPSPQLWWYLLVGSLGLIAVLATITTIQRILFTYIQSRSNQQEVNH